MNLVKTGEYALPGYQRGFHYSDALYTSLNKVNVTLLAGIFRIFGTDYWWYTFKIIPLTMGVLLLLIISKFSKSKYLDPLYVLLTMLLVASDPMFLRHVSNIRSEITIGFWAISLVYILFLINEDRNNNKLQWLFASLLAVGHWVSITTTIFIFTLCVTIFFLDFNLKWKLTFLARIGISFLILVFPYYVWIFIDDSRSSFFMIQTTSFAISTENYNLIQLVYRSVYKIIATFDRMFDETISPIFIICSIILSIFHIKSNKGNARLWLLILLIPVLSLALVSYRSPRKIFMLIPIGYICFFWYIIYLKNWQKIIGSLYISVIIMFAIRTGMIFLKYVVQENISIFRFSSSWLFLKHNFYIFFPYFITIVISGLILFIIYKQFAQKREMIFRVILIFICSVVVVYHVSGFITQRKQYYNDIDIINYTTENVNEIKATIDKYIPKGKVVYTSPFFYTIFSDFNNLYRMHMPSGNEARRFNSYIRNNPPDYIVLSGGHMKWFDESNKDKPLYKYINNNFKITKRTYKPHAGRMWIYKKI